MNAFKKVGIQPQRAPLPPRITYIPGGKWNSKWAARDADGNVTVFTQYTHAQSFLLEGK